MPHQTLETLPRRFNSFQAAKCFDLARRKYKFAFRLVDGVIAQLVERLNGIQEVRSSSLLGSTILRSEPAVGSERRMVPSVAVAEEGVGDRF